MTQSSGAPRTPRIAASEGQARDAFSQGGADVSSPLLDAWNVAFAQADSQRASLLAALKPAVMGLETAAPSATPALTAVQLTLSARAELLRKLASASSWSASETHPAPPEDATPPTSEQLESLRERGLFDESFYREQAGLSARENAWSHFLNHGAAAGLDVHPLVHSDRARRRGLLPESLSASQWIAIDHTAADLATSPLFDPAYYVSHNLIELAHHQSALEHYIKHGRGAGSSTHAVIDLGWIKAHWPTGAGHDFELINYLRNPALFRLSPHPLFDPDWYAASGSVSGNPLEHYLSIGHLQGRSPNRWFDEFWYKRQVRDLAPGESGLAHYLRAGKAQRLQPHPVFDRDLYLRLHGKAVQDNADPYTHFVAFGASQGFTGGHLMHQIQACSGGWASPPEIAEALAGRAEAFDILTTRKLAGLARQERLHRQRAVWQSLARPLRVARKRLRMIGLLPKTKPRGAGFFARRAPAPNSLKAFLAPLPPYEAWRHNNRFTAAARVDLESRLAASAPGPKFSILSPVYNTPASHLKEMVSSVIGQVYQNWELCIVDDASPDRRMGALLDELAALDPRIRVQRRAINGGISEASNDAAAMATGEIFALVDHDDCLTPDALGEMALYYAGNPEADIVYSDDDKFDGEGAYYAHQFKPDWSPVLLLSYMYLSHLLTVRRSVFEAVGGFRKAFDGSQDYDFALRASEVARHVGHLPKVLYHWRATPGSTAMSGDAKPESFKAGLNAVQEAMDRRGLKAQVRQPEWAKHAKVGMFSLTFPDTGPTVTIIVPTFNQLAYLRDCIESLALTTYENYDVLVVDNGSDDEGTLSYLDELRDRPRHAVKVIARNKDGFSFAALMNEAVASATGEYVLLLNNDTRVISPQWLSQMVGYAGMDGVGSVGAKLYFGDDTVQHAGIVRGFNEGLAGHAFRNASAKDWGYMGFLKTSREYSAVTAACVLTPASTFKALGGFDENRFAVAYNDADYGFRLADSGRTNVYCADAELYHFEGKTRPKRDDPREVVALREEYGTWRDRWYNPNLSLDHETFAVSTRRSSGTTSSAIKVAVVSHSLSREGAPNTLLDLVLGLKHAGVIDPVVFSPVDGPLREAYEDAGVEVRLFSIPSFEDSARQYAEQLKGIAAAFSDCEAQVVISNTLTMFQAINAAEVAGLASIWCQHESEPWETYFDHLPRAQRTYAYAAFGQAYRVTYVAQATRLAWAGVQTRHNAQLIRHGIPPLRLAAETGRWARAEARHGLGEIADDDFVILLAGTICSRKGQLDAIRMMEHLPVALLSRTRLFIAGAVAEPDYLAEMQRALGKLLPEAAKCVVITGPVEDMTQYFAAADIYLCTSRVESAPRVIVEAMAFKLPIITTPVFGIPELVDEGINAVFYDPGDVVALASELSSLIDDTNKRRAFAEAAPFVLRSRPGYSEMLNDYEALIREAALVGEASNLKA